MIYFARGEYSGPGCVKLNRAPPGINSGRLDPIHFLDELYAEVRPHTPVLVGPFPLRTAVVLWLRRAGAEVVELPAEVAAAA